MSFACAGLHSGPASLIFASQEQRNTEHAVDRHQLAAMMHLMLLHACEHIVEALAAMHRARQSLGA
jgi:hypothetical protein